MRIAYWQLREASEARRVGYCHPSFPQISATFASTTAFRTTLQQLTSFRAEAFIASSQLFGAEDGIHTPQPKAAGQPLDPQRSSGELQFYFPSAAADGTHDDFYVVPQTRHELQ